MYTYIYLVVFKGLKNYIYYFEAILGCSNVSPFKSTEWSKISMCLFIFQCNSHLGEETLLTMPRMTLIKTAKAEDKRANGGKCVRALYPLSLCCSSYLGFSKYLW